MSRPLNTPDLAGESYWSANWQAHSLPGPIDPHDAGMRNRVRRQLHRLFQETFEKYSLNGCRLLEIGCARSVWLPYFSKVHGCKVTGIDYSRIGCDQARAILDRERAEGTVVEGDLFEPIDGLAGTFDCVVTFGVVEHFADTARCLAAIAKWIRPGGVTITIVPNMTGIIGLTQSLVDRKVFDVHVPLTLPALASAHGTARIETLEATYLTRLNFGVCNVNSQRPHSIGWLIRKVALRSFAYGSYPFYLFEGDSRARTASRFLSSYALVIGRRGDQLPPS